MKPYLTSNTSKLIQLGLLLFTMLGLSLDAHAVSDTVCAYTDSHVYSTPYDSGHSYTWSVQGGNIVKGQNTDSIWVNWKSGNDTGVIKLTETNLSNCDSTVRDSIYIAPKPAPTIAGKDTVCAFTGTHSYTTSGRSGHSYTWTVTGGTIQSGAGSDSITVKWNNSGTGTVQLKESNVSSCDSSVTKNIHIDPRPSPAISGKDTACAFTSGQAYTTANKSGYSYSWTVTGGTITSGRGTDSITVDWQGADSGNVQLKSTNAAGCDTTIHKPIHIDPKPAPAITGKDTLCTNSTIAYTTSGSPGNSYSWSVTNGNIVSGSGTDSITVNWSTGGAGTVKLTETTADGCDTTVSKDITIDPKPTPVIQGKAPVCEQSIAAYHVGSDTTHTFSWSVSGGSITQGAGTDSITVDWGSGSSGTVNLTETNNEGCDTAVSKNINIDPKPEPVIQGKKDFCDGNQAFVYLDNPHPSVTYDWTIEGGRIQNNPDRDSIAVQWSAPGEPGVATVTAQNEQGCFSADTHTAQIHPKPNPLLKGPVQLCENTSEALYKTNTDSNQRVEWQITGGTVQKKRTA